MFSVGGDSENSDDIPTSAVYLGLEPAVFSYTGGAGTALGGRFEFSGPLLRLRWENPGVSFSLATGGTMTGLEGISYFDAGLEAGYDVGILRSDRVLILLPLKIVSSMTSVSTDQNIAGAPQFKQGALIAGAGAQLAIHPTGNLRLQAGFVPQYGFSFATGGTFGGSLAKLEGSFRFFLDRIFGDMGLSLGYDYLFKRFDIEQNQFDYDLGAHSILLGVTF